MGKKHKNLFELIVTDENLRLAYAKAAKGKRKSIGYLEFKQNDSANLARIKQALITGTYRPALPRKFMVHEPKAREISALPFHDRVVQHALCNIIEPIFDKVFVPQSYACRVSKGTHSAVKQVQSMLRKDSNKWVLKTDFSKYFASIDLAILHTEFRRKLSCQDTLALLETFIPKFGHGLPIGNLTSQLAANVYGHIIDRWLLHSKQIATFVRYMDDIVIIGNTKESLIATQREMKMFIDTDMHLHFSHWSITPGALGINFCGYRIWKTHKLIRKSSVQAARKRINTYTRLGQQSALQKFIAAWNGHIKFANCFNLQTTLLRK